MRGAIYSVIVAISALALAACGGGREDACSSADTIHITSGYVGGNTLHYSPNQTSSWPFQVTGLPEACASQKRFAVVAFASSPILPTGLTIDPLSGTISGKITDERQTYSCLQTGNVVRPPGRCGFGEWEFAQSWNVEMTVPGFQPVRTMISFSRSPGTAGMAADSHSLQSQLLPDHD